MTVCRRTTQPGALDGAASSRIACQALTDCGGDGAGGRRGRERVARADRGARRSVVAARRVGRARAALRRPAGDRQGVPPAGEVRQRAAGVRAVGAGDRRPRADAARCGRRRGRCCCSASSTVVRPSRSQAPPTCTAGPACSCAGSTRPSRRVPLDGYPRRAARPVRRLGRPGPAGRARRPRGRHRRRVARPRRGPADPLGVPCHRDWQPRNWLVDDAGEPWAIDFEHARVGPWFEDVGRLWWREWQGRPDLAEAFFDGYGRRLDGDDRRWFDIDLGAVAPDDDRVGRRARRPAVPRRGPRPPPIDVRRLNAARLPTRDP